VNIRGIKHRLQKEIFPFFLSPLWVLLKRSGNGPVLIYVPHVGANVDIKYLLAYQDKPGVPYYVVVDCESYEKLANELRRLGEKVICRGGKEEFELLKRASVIVSSNDVLSSEGRYWYALGARYIQLWHGLNIKLMGFYFYNVGPKRSPWRQFYHSFINHTYRYDTMIIPRWLYSQLFKRYFAFRKALYGLPVRNDFWFCRSKFDIGYMRLGVDTNKLKYIQLQKNKGKKIVLFIPTWRINFSWKDFMISTQFIEKLDEWAKKNDAWVVMKFHPLEELGNFSLTRKNLGEFRGMELLADNVMVYRGELGTFSDVMPLLELGDILITDYSSVYFDFLIGKPFSPILFFWFDYDEYVADNPLEEKILPYVTPGEKAYNVETLIRWLDKIAKGEDKYLSARIKLQRSLMGENRNICLSEIIWNIIGKVGESK